MDLVHAHASSNTLDGIAQMDGTDHCHLAIDLPIGCTSLCCRTRPSSCLWNIVHAALQRHCQSEAKKHNSNIGYDDRNQ